MSEQFAHLTGGPAVSPAPEGRGAPEPRKPASKPSRHDGFAITSFVLSLFGWVGMVPGLVFGYLSLHRAKRDHEKRSGLAIAGIVISWVSVAALALVLTVMAAVKPAPTASAASPAAAPASSAPVTQSPGSNPFGDSDPTNDPNYAGGASVDVPQPTMAQQQALESAQGYLDMGDGMSKAGLLDQLHSHYGEGFKLADARWAVNHVHANWNHQAVLSAKGYLDMGDGMSRAGLIDQLSSPYGEQFTLAQATYAANHVGL